MLNIHRWYQEDCTVSRLTIEGHDFQCWLLELPDLENQKNISCIPEGTYTAFKRVSPSRGKEVIQYRDVPNRTYIQIHPGNFTRQIQGCQLPGSSLAWIDGDVVPDVTNSEATFEKLMSLVPDEFSITIHS